MIEKGLVWLGNLFLAAALVYLSMSPASAQDDELLYEEPTRVQPNIYGAATEPGKIQVPLSGTATLNTGSNLKVTPSAIDAGLVEIGESVELGFTLTHDGVAEADPIVINSVELFGAHAGEFTTDLGLTTLYPGESVDGTVRFTPMISGQKSAGLRFNIEGLSAPFALLMEGWSRWPLTSDLAVSKTKLDFGQQLIGSKATQKLILQNLGEVGAPAVSVQAFNFGGEDAGSFDIDESLPVTIQPGEQKVVSLAMDTGALGTFNSELELVHTGNNRAVKVDIAGVVVEPQSIPLQFSMSELKNASTNRGTVIQFGPDDRLYVGLMNGKIDVYSVTRNGKNNYTASKDETINLIFNSTNHNDDGSVNHGLSGRQMTGFTVVGTAANPIIYVASSDPRQAAGPSGLDSNLDTNSGILHKLVKTGTSWIKHDLVRGLPRSEENHAPNGIALKDGKIYLILGGNTNMGAPSNNFAEQPEYALSAALLEIDIEAIGNGTYDLPTLDDEDRPGNPDSNDPFGGNDGKNQAILESNGPVKLYATGFRNAYDLVHSSNDELFTFDNGPNGGWGGEPVGSCTNNIDNGGVKLPDHLIRIEEGGYYGHPNPTRGNKNNKFNASNPQSPIEGNARAQECHHKLASEVGALTTINASSNGMVEYTASNFGLAMKGDLLVAAYGKNIYRIELDNSGKNYEGKSVLLSGMGSTPLDVTAQGDDDIFPGTIWVVDNIDSKIRVFEPSDY